METGSKAARRGFTLIEMMVVISIIMILAGMVLYGVQIAIDSARRSDTQALCMQVRDAISMYYTDCKVYPTHDATPPFTHLELVYGNGVDGLWVYQLQRMGKKPPYLMGIDDTKLTLSSNRGEIIDHYDSALRFRVVGRAEYLSEYYRNSNTLKTFYVWSCGKNQNDDFTSTYGDPLWDTLATDFKTFQKLSNPESWADSQGIDDIIVTN